MITNFEVRELQTVGRADHNRLVLRLDHAAANQLGQHGESNSRVWTGEHPGQVRMGRGRGQFGLRRLFDDSIRFFDGLDGFG